MRNKFFLFNIYCYIYRKDYNETWEAVILWTIMFYEISYDQVLSCYVLKLSSFKFFLFPLYLLLI